VLCGAGGGFTVQAASVRPTAANSTPIITRT
jgi:hypothetical protein